MESITLQKSSILKIGIKDNEGNDTGNVLEFDLEDTELPLRLQQCLEEHKKNHNYLANQFKIIDKQEDRKGKKLLSHNEEEKLKALNEFYKKEIATMDLFLGEGGTMKMLNGRKPYFSMFDDINESLKPILPKLTVRAEDIQNRIINKYKNNVEEDVLE